MKLWMIGLGVIGAYIVYKKFLSKPFAGMVASGWSAGNSNGNLPSLVPIIPIIGRGANGSPVYGPPGVNYGPSRTTNDGSAGG